MASDPGVIGGVRVFAEGLTPQQLPADGFGLPMSPLQPPASRQPPPPPWLLVVTPGGEFTVECDDRPDAVRRFFQRWLLGWRWVRNERKSFPSPG